MTCSFQPDLMLDEWLDSMLEPLGNRRYPLSASFELTERCNLSCVHCYINQSAGDPNSRSKELTTSQAIHLLDQMAGAGCLFLLLTGGEPLLREDFPDIFRHARRLGLIVSLFSNGTLLTPQLADVLAEGNLHSLEITLYGATRETYEKVTNQPGSYERCLRGIELALSRGLKVYLKSVLLTINQVELDAMKALTEHYGLEFRYDSTLWPRLDGNKINMRYQVAQDVILTLDLHDPERNQAWQKTADQFKNFPLRAERVFTCGAAYRSFHVDRSGRMTPCMMVRRPKFDVLDLGFDQAWEKLGQIREMKRELHTRCESCSAAAMCTQCPGWSLAVNNDYETPVQAVCDLGLKRAARFSYIEM